MKQNDNEVLALPCECWRWFTGYEDIVQVSTRGRVKTVGRWVNSKGGSKRFIEGRILKPGRNEDGYLYVKLYRDGKRRHFYVHRMVLEVWGDGNPENKPQVNHIDENKANNAVENLSWSTCKENINWGTGIERHAGSKSTPVQAVNPSTGAVTLEFPSAREAERNGFNQSHISACCRGERRRHRGLIWHYKES